MKFIYYFAALYLGLLGIGAFFVELNKWNWYLKLALGLVAGVAVILTFAYQMFEKKVDEVKREYSEMRAENRTREIKKGIEELKEKEKKGLLTPADYSLYISRYLESIDNTLKYQEGKNDRELVTTYYEEVSKIPSYFSIKEWEESEKFIYDSMVNEINNQFAFRGTFDSGVRIQLLGIFEKERKRLIEAKERGSR
ncbi:MAG: hypothetical protein PHH69_03720 [Candidatus Omnitrophica bacterium]|nr:hypothetical protein [Candidatus Omnitrophota bacterium]MDD5610638.1 hypothetical protein [Candidatus Omnitrophota bacterium]